MKEIRKHYFLFNWVYLIKILTMNWLPTFILFTIITTSSLAQTSIYHPFNDTTQWSVLNQYFGEDDSTKTLYKYYGIGDTIIDGTKYLQIDYNGLTGDPYYLIHDDTTNKKIYFRDGIGVNKLIYDFNVIAGDNLSHTYTFSIWPDAYLESIDSILIGDDYRKKFNIRYTNQYFNPEIGGFEDSLVLTFWIEGIGSEYGPLLNYVMDIGYEINNKFELLCYFENVDQLYSKVSEHANCDSTYIDYSIDIKEDLLNQSFVVYPNPITNFFIIETPINALDIKIQMFDLSGRIIAIPIKTIIGANKIKFDVTNIQSGFYLLKINFKNKSYIKKIIIN